MENSYDIIIMAAAGLQGCMRKAKVNADLREREMGAKPPPQKSWRTIPARLNSHRSRDHGKDEKTGRGIRGGVQGRECN